MFSFDESSRKGNEFLLKNATMTMTPTTKHDVLRIASRYFALLLTRLRDGFPSKSIAACREQFVWHYFLSPIQGRSQINSGGAVTSKGRAELSVGLFSTTRPYRNHHVTVSY